MHAALRRYLLLVTCPLFATFLSVPAFSQQSTDYLYGISSDDRLIEITVPISSTTFSETVIGSTNLPGIAGLTYDVNANVLYGVTIGGLLAVVDRHTGQATAFQLLPFTGSPNFTSLAFEETNNKKYLYVADGGTNRSLYKVEITGQLPYPVTRIGAIQFDVQVTGLAIQSSSGRLYAINRFPAKQLIVSENLNSRFYYTQRRS